MLLKLSKILPSKREKEFHENPMTLGPHQSAVEDFPDPPMSLALVVTPAMSKCQNVRETNKQRALLFGTRLCQLGLWGTNALRIACAMGHRSLFLPFAHCAHPPRCVFDFAFAHCAGALGRLLFNHFAHCAPKGLGLLN